MTDHPKRILILRRGSIGDGVVSLPALHYLARAYPDSERRILTNRPVAESAAPLEAVIKNTELVAGFFYFDPRSKNLGALLRLARYIRRWQPDTLIYLSEPSGYVATLKEIGFFILCGIRKFKGVPLGGSLRRYRRLNDHLWEAESQRLMRAVGAGEDVEPDWSMPVNEQDVTDAELLLGGWKGRSRHFALSIGAKLEDKDWGDTNWRATLDVLSQYQPVPGIVLIGAKGDRERSAAITADWPGPALNLCGRCSPMVSASVMKHAMFYLGHDSGPMHLAAMVGTPCIAVFSARAKPGVWYPHGNGHQILYPLKHAGHAPARPGFRHGGSTIQDISVQSVIDACEKYLGDTAAQTAEATSRKGGT